MIQGLVRSVLKVEKNGEAHLINSGLTDIDGAKQIAANLFGYYDKDKSGSIDTVKVTFIFYIFRPYQCSTTLIEYLIQIPNFKNKM